MVDFSTWGQLINNFCSNQRSINPDFYEDFANRRYNFSTKEDTSSCRLVFLKDVLKDHSNKTLSRRGRFIWCHNLQYEGKNENGLRGISFTIDQGNKRFFIDENNILALPSKVCVNNSGFFRAKQKTFLSFSTVFSYRKALHLMAKSEGMDIASLSKIIEEDSPYRPGTLVNPREGYFYPNLPRDKTETEIMSHHHPCGIILGPAVRDNNYVNKEFYRVRFGDTTYERVHPVQMEIIK